MFKKNIWGITTSGNYCNLILLFKISSYIHPCFQNQISIQYKETDRKSAYKAGTLLNPKETKYSTWETSWKQSCSWKLPSSMLFWSGLQRENVHDRCHFGTKPKFTVTQGCSNRKRGGNHMIIFKTYGLGCSVSKVSIQRSEVKKKIIHCYLILKSFLYLNTNLLPHCLLSKDCFKF